MTDRRFVPKKKPSASRGHAALLILLAVLLTGSIFMFWPPQDKIKQGIDLRGGLSVVMQATKAGGVPSDEEMKTALQIIESRINVLGASEAYVQRQGSDQLAVEIPGSTEDESQILTTLSQPGELMFVNIEEEPLKSSTDIQAFRAGYYVDAHEINVMLALHQISEEQIYDSIDGETPVNTQIINGRVPAGMYYDPLAYSGQSSSGYNYYKRIMVDPSSYTKTDPDTGEVLYDEEQKPQLDRKIAIFGGDEITQVRVEQESQVKLTWAVKLNLNSAAAERFKEATTQLAPTKGCIGIVLDGALQSAPAVQSVIPNGEVSITGDYTIEQANSLKVILDSGSLPVKTTIIQHEVIGPTLGQEALYAGVLVALIGLALVALYLFLFYRGIGLLTSGAIFVFALLYLGVLALLSYFNFFTLSLAGIAGIVLSIGVAADSSILVLERFKEEIRMGRSVRASAQTGVHHAIITSIDADFVTLISALSLFFISVGPVKGFGLTLALGVVCDVITMVIFKAPLIRLLAPKVISRHPGFWGVREDADFAAEAGELVRGESRG